MKGIRERSQRAALPERDAARARRLLVATFPIAFALHDLEEILGAGPWGRTAPERLRECVPWLPERIVARTRTTTRDMAVAVGVVSAGVALGTAIAWTRRDADLRPLPAMLAVYTLHGGTHVLLALVARGYVPGVVTVPLVIVPYSIWAWRTVSRAGIAPPRRTLGRDAILAALAAVGLAGAGHLIGGSRSRTG